MEDCEGLRNRAPSDVDVVTLASRPVSANDKASWDALVAANQLVFTPSAARAAFRCDAYFVDLDSDPQLILRTAIYFFGLFSHQRTSSLWKGMVEVPLTTTDDDVLNYLANH